MLLTQAQMQELNAVREEVRAITGASSVSDARKLVDEVNQMMTYRRQLDNRMATSGNINGGLAASGR